MDWEIVRAANVGDALTTHAALLHGETDTDGKVLLTPDQEKLLKLAYDESPNELWVLYAGQARELVMTEISETWTNQQKWQHALDAMGYTDRICTTNGEVIDGAHNLLVRNDIGANSGASLLKKIEGES